MTKIIPYLIIFAICFLVSMPLLKPGFYTVHDDQQIARLFLFDQGLKSGQFPVRWVDELGFGFGYPLFVFYPPLVYMIGEIFHLVSFGFIDSIKLVFFTGVFLSGIAMYILVKDLWGKLSGLVSAIFYVLVPYRALDVYVRGAMAESFSFVWLPLILWSFYKMFETQKIFYIYISGVFLALLMITHNLIFLPYMLILLFYLLFLTCASNDKRKFIRDCILSVVCSLGLSAFFWMPAILEKKFTLVDNLLLTDLANYRVHFVYLQQLWNWTWGYGGSAPGLADGISFKIGKIHILASIAALLFSILILLKNKKLSKLSTLFFALFIFSAFMTTAYSQVIWSRIPQLAYLQFPWRFLTFTALFSSILAAFVIRFLRFSIFKLIAAAILVALLLVGNLKLFKPQDYRLSLTDSEATSKNIIYWDVSSSSFEYIPKGIQVQTDEFGKRIPPIDKSQIPTSKIENNPDLQISSLVIKPTKIEFIANVLKPTNILFNMFNFPGWQAYIDGEKTQISDNNRLRLITISAPQGTHQILIKFVNTPITSLANALSILTLLTTALLLLKQRIQIKFVDF